MTGISFSKLNRSLSISIMMIAGLLSLSACTSNQPTKQIWGPGTPYVLGPGDVVRVTVYGDDQLSGEFTIDPAGHISMPLASRMIANNKTVEELEQAITTVLSPKYVRDASVTIDVIEYGSVFVLGEVRSPGKYPYTPNMTVMQSVAVAGGHTYRGEESGADVTRPYDGVLKTIYLGGNEMIMPGDTVYIGRRWF